jgi:hypothetical protein
MVRLVAEQVQGQRRLAVRTDRKLQLARGHPEMIEREKEHQHHRDDARQVAPGEPVDQRVEHVGEDRAGEERREDGREHVEQAADHQSDRQPGPQTRVGEKRCLHIT